MERIRLAVIGGGLIGARHAELVCAGEACALVGICDTDPARRTLAEGLGVPFYARAEELLERERPDGAIIAAPNAEHARLAVACAERGVHILIEKPVADTLAEAQQIVSAAREHGVSVLVGHHRRHSPLAQHARSLVQGGALGRLVGFSVLWTLLKPDGYFRVAWRRERPGGGPLLINLIHDLDSLRFICGEVATVYAQTASAVRGFEVEDSLSLSLVLENGALGTVLASDATPAPWSYETTAGENPFYFHVPESCYHFVGTEASLAWPAMELWRYAAGASRGWGEPLERRQLAVPAADPLPLQLDHFCRVVRGEQVPLVGAEDAARTLAVAVAAHESARIGAPVDVATLWPD